MCFFGTMGTIPCFASPSLCLEMCEESILLKDTMDTTLERVTETTSSSTKRHCCVVVVVFLQQQYYKCVCCPTCLEKFWGSWSYSGLVWERISQLSPSGNI